MARVPQASVSASPKNLLQQQSPNRATAMDANPAANGAAGLQHVASPNGTSKLSQHSPDAHSWSDEGSSGDEAVDRSQSGTSSKRKRPLSVSCETCKTRKVKCDRGEQRKEMVTPPFIY